MSFPPSNAVCVLVLEVSARKNCRSTARSFKGSISTPISHAIHKFDCLLSEVAVPAVVPGAGFLTRILHDITTRIRMRSVHRMADVENGGVMLTVMFGFASVQAL